ncbi:MAG: addiction module antidote protein [Terriglobales bacterium]
MPSKTRPYREALLEALSDSEVAASYLTAAMNDSPDMFRKALRNVAQARQMARVARNAGVTRESLYRATSEIGNPTLDTLDSVLTAVGIKIKFEAEEVLVAPTPPVSGATTGRGASDSSVVYRVKMDPFLSRTNATYLSCLTYEIGSGMPIGPRHTFGEVGGGYHTCVIQQSGIGKQSAIYTSSEPVECIFNHGFRLNAEQAETPQNPFVPSAENEKYATALQP